eukprot:858261-Amphidinium_carterae.1
MGYTLTERNGVPHLLHATSVGRPPQRQHTKREVTASESHTHDIAVAMLAGSSPHIISGRLSCASLLRSWPFRTQVAVQIDITVWGGGGESQLDASSSAKCNRP